MKITNFTAFGTAKEQTWNEIKLDECRKDAALEDGTKKGPSTDNKGIKVVISEENH